MGVLLVNWTLFWTLGVPDGYTINERQMKRCRYSLLNPYILTEFGL